MFLPICIIDFSGTKISGTVALRAQTTGSIDKWGKMPLSLPWNVGFQEQADGTLRTLFNEELEQLEPTTQDVIQFWDLDDHLPQITDEQTLAYLFGAFLEEVFYNYIPAATNQYEL